MKYMQSISAKNILFLQVRLKETKGWNKLLWQHPKLRKAASYEKESEIFAYTFYVLAYY